MKYKNRQEACTIVTSAGVVADCGNFVEMAAHLKARMTLVLECVRTGENFRVVELRIAGISERSADHPVLVRFVATLDFSGDSRGQEISIELPSGLRK